MAAFIEKRKRPFGRLKIADEGSRSIDLNQRIAAHGQIAFICRLIKLHRAFATASAGNTSSVSLVNGRSVSDTRTRGAYQSHAGKH